HLGHAAEERGLERLDLVELLRARGGTLARLGNEVFRQLKLLFSVALDVHRFVPRRGSVTFTTRRCVHLSWSKLRARGKWCRAYRQRFAIGNGMSPGADGIPSRALKLCSRGCFGAVQICGGRPGKPRTGGGQTGARLHRSTPPPAWVHGLPIPGERATFRR